MQKKNHTPFLISIEGNIGVGKSTFLRKLGSALPDMVMVGEPHEEWQNVGGYNILDHFYRDMQRWAYTFQQYVFLTRTRALERAFAAHPSHTVFVGERSTIADFYTFTRACFDLTTINQLEWNMYTSWFFWLIESIKLPDLFLYLRCEVDTAYERIMQRKRNEEMAISYEYLTLIHQYHDDWLLHRKRLIDCIAAIPVHVVQVDKDFEHDNEAWELLVNKVKMLVPQREQGCKERGVYYGRDC